MAGYGGQADAGYGQQQTYQQSPPQAQPVQYAAPTPHQGSPLKQPLTTGGSSDGSAAQGTRFGYTDSEYRDKPWAILFLIQLLGLIACGVLYAPDLWNESQTDDDSLEGLDTSQLIQLGWLTAASLIVAGITGAVWLGVMQRKAKIIIKISLFMNTALLMCAGFYCLYLGAIFPAAIYLIFAAFTIFYYMLVRRRIPFTQAILASATEAIKENSGPVWVAYLCCFLQILFLTGWSFAAGGIVYKIQSDGGSVSGGLIFVLLVSFYWTAQVIINVGHVTTAGVVASWWFQPSATDRTRGAFKRATTTSFGSICFGSLIVAILKAAYAMVQEARKSENNFARCCAACLLNCLQRLIEYFNMYAYTQVAIYGKDFRQAAKDTWDLFTARGFQIIINDDLTGMVLTMGCFIGGIVTAAAGYALAYLFYDDADLALTMAILGFILGFFVVAVIMNVIQSAVATTFVVWAEDPAAMSQARPGWFNNIRTARDAMYPGRRW
jgi:hypothetical protein